MGGAQPGSPSAEVPPRSATVTVEQVSAMPPGSRAVVRGLYLGWRGPCRGAPPTRSAWQLADSNQPSAACLYVDGPSPPGLDPAGPGGAPTWVRVDAELIVAGPDRFLASRSAEREAP